MLTCRLDSRGVISLLNLKRNSLRFVPEPDSLRFPTLPHFCRVSSQGKSHRVCAGQVEPNRNVGRFILCRRFQITDESVDGHVQKIRSYVHPVQRLQRHQKGNREDEQRNASAKWARYVHGNSPLKSDNVSREFSEATRLSAIDQPLR